MSSGILVAMGREEDGVLVLRVRAGDTQAFASLFERWYDRVFNVARAIVRRPELAADVAQDTFLAGWQQLDRLDDVNAFGGWLLKIARHKALDALRREGRATATDDDVVADLRDRGLPDPTAASVLAGPVDAAEAEETDALLWAAAAALGARDASLLDLHLRHGLTPAELAADLGVTPNHAHQLVFRLRKRLEEAVGSFLLWRGGRPACAGLAATAGATAAFDAGTAGVIRRHERACAACQSERRRQTDPTKLFAAVPLALVPLMLRARSAAALAAEGVPVPAELTSIAAAGRDVADDPGGQATGDEAGESPTGPHSTGVAGTRAATPFAGAGSGAPVGARVEGEGVEGGGADGTEAGAAGGPPSRLRRRPWMAVAALALLIVVGTSLVVADAARAPSSEPAEADAPSTAAGALTPRPVTTVAGTARVGTTTSTTSSSTTSTISTTSSTFTTSTTTTMAPLIMIPVDPASVTTPPAVLQPHPDADEPPPDVYEPPPPPPDPPPPPPPPRPPSTTTTEPPTTTITVLPPPPPAPAATILRFTLVGASHRCDAGLDPYGLGWVTENATEVTLVWRGQSTAVGVSGQQALCLASGDAVTLRASSAGGSDTATVTAP